MNTTRVITIVCWIITALVLIGLLLWFLAGSIFGGSLGDWFRSRDGNWSIGFGIENPTGHFVGQGTQTLSTTDIHSVDIGWVAGVITVIPHDGSDIQITEYAQRELKENERMRVNTDGGKLSVRFRDREISAGRMPPKNLEVHVPRELSENLTTLTIATTSGTISADDFKMTTANFTSVSANIWITGIVSNDIGLNTTSGTITAASLRAGRMNISSVSGALNVTDSTITILDSSTTSGGTYISGEFDRVDVSTVSGRTILNSTTVPDRVSVSSVSGDTDLYIPNNGEITVSHSAVSGRFSSEIPAIIQNGAAYTFSAVSGNTNIYILQ